MSENTTPENTFTAAEREHLEAQYRRIAVIPSESGDYEIVIKPAERLQWRKFRADSADENKRDAAQETLVTACVVACAYDGAKTTDAKEARTMLIEKLLKDWAGACDGAAVFRLIQQLNMGQGERRAK